MSSQHLCRLFVMPLIDMLPGLGCGFVNSNLVSLFCSYYSEKGGKKKGNHHVCCCVHPLGTVASLLFEQFHIHLYHTDLTNIYSLESPDIFKTSNSFSAHFDQNLISKISLNYKSHSVKHRNKQLLTRTNRQICLFSGQDTRKVWI